jgi:predicted AAA+ superfamily ATPase
MATSNRDRVGRALEVLQGGLKPFVERELSAVHGKYWVTRVTENWNNEIKWIDDDTPHLDISPLLRMMWDQWNTVFSRTLGPSERSLVAEIRASRHKWAHQESFSLDDTYRTLDSTQRLLQAISAGDAAQEIERQKQARKETRKAAVAAIEGQPAGGLKPWREVITPHPDVASGRYQQAEFAADLSQVHRGEGADEYRDPRAFFQRTFLTEGLRHLLTTALRRVSNTGGDPVVELQTNFGGGKTHSMLALYHLFSGVQPGSLIGIEPVLDGAGVTALPAVQRAVLVGTALSPAQPHRKPDGTVVNTFWGELAWQLVGREGYDLVADADRDGINPGSNTLNDLFRAAAPCLILIDEWVAYVRQLYVHPDDQQKSVKRNLSGGSFESNMSFAQSLTEAARAVPGVLVVASIPASDIEIGGEGGREALSRLQNIFGRMESAWRPATTEEGFEIVRRRLFQPITDPGLFTARDAVIKHFMDLYRQQSAEFPPECREAEYERRLQTAYPIHPELFDRLYNDWGTLDRFQRTRGVLRLMSAVIHALWEREDRNLMIMPASVPVDAAPVQYELTRYLDAPWTPVIEKDVDGPNSLPLRIDREQPNLGRYSAARRVARTLYLGSAPTQHLANKGLDDRRIKLGCVQPGETVATFGDALRRLTDQATHLYVDGQRYWFSVQPTVNRLAHDRALQQTEDDVWGEIVQHLRQHEKQRGDFTAVHTAPGTSADVPDERDVRLVILPPGACHMSKTPTSAARTLAEEMLAQRGSSPRRNKNTLVFLAADNTRLKDLDMAVRQLLAWRSIESESETLNLDPFQARQAKTKRTQAEEAVKQRIPETYIWLLAPEQLDPQDDMTWTETRLLGQDSLAVRASRKLRNDALLVTDLGATVLKMWLDKIPLWRGDTVTVRQLADDFAQYVYLPRLQNTQVLLDAIQDGVAMLTWEQDGFAYAEGYDPATDTYRGLRAGQTGRVILDNDSLVIRSDVARRKLDAAVGPPPASNPPRPAVSEPDNGGTTPPSPRPSTATVDRQLRRFHGSKQLDATRLNRDAGQIADEVLQHLASLVGARVRVTLEIEADLPNGAPDHIVRTVTENCRTLRFDSSGFEEL